MILFVFLKYEKEFSLFQVIESVKNLSLKSMK